MTPTTFDEWKASLPQQDRLWLVDNPTAAAFCELAWYAGRHAGGVAMAEYHMKQVTAKD